MSNNDNPSARTRSHNPQRQPERHQANRQSSEIEVETLSPKTPLIMGDNKPKSTRPTLAKPESVDNEEIDNREIVTKPYPGIDDGFFRNSEKPEMNDETTTNTNGTKPHSHSDDHGHDEHEKQPHDENDGFPHHGSRRPSVVFPHFPTYDPEIGSGLNIDEIPDLNVYQHKKTLAQGMMDLALFSANANQLRYVLDSYERHPYYYPSMVLIVFSLALQVAIGVLLIWNATYNVKDEKEVCRANKINNYTVIGIFLVTVVNVFISAFGVADPPTNTSVIVGGNNST